MRAIAILIYVNVNFVCKLCCQCITRTKESAFVNLSTDNSISVCYCWVDLVGEDPQLPRACNGRFLLREE